MTTTHTARGIAIRVLAIIGFLATVSFIVWVLAQGLMKLPQGFASLASLAESIEMHRPVKELSLATNSSVVNSGESFDLSWTKMRTDGVYTLTPTCTSGVSLEVAFEGTDRTPLSCTTGVTIPKNVSEATVFVTSTENRFDSATLALSFAGDNIEKKSETKITVVNAQIPFAETPKEKVVEETTPVVTETPTVVTSTETAPSTQAPVARFVDLAVEHVGIGMIRNGEFKYTGAYDPQYHNVIKFRVRNNGTITSPSWAFTSKLPGGGVYESDVQEPLRPGEIIEFTLGFNFDTRDVGRHTDIETVVYVKDDASQKNNSATWSVRVRD